MTNPRVGCPDGLCTCGCCDHPSTAPSIANRAGLPALSYRIGTHATFMRAMLDRLAAPSVDDAGASLSRLTTRATDDPVIALLDAWAVMGDVLTFYHERIANEGFLRTAVERRSVVELARAIGYEPSPGVAASAFLAFTVDPAPGAPGRASVPEGTRVQSVPGQGEHPQTFETVEAIEADVAWNDLTPRMANPPAFSAGRTQMWLQGLATQLQPGDMLLLVGDDRVKHPGSERWDVRALATVEPDKASNRTRVTWAEALGSAQWNVAPAIKPRAYVFRQRAALFGWNAPDWTVMDGDKVQTPYLSRARKIDPNHAATGQWPGFEVPDTTILDSRAITTPKPGDAARASLHLDNAYPKIVAGSWLVLTSPSYTELYNLVNAEASSLTNFTLSSKTTRVELDTDESLREDPNAWPRNTFRFGDKNNDHVRRDITVFAQSEELAIADDPIDDVIQGRVVELATLVAPLENGRTVIVSGKRARARVNTDNAKHFTLEPLDGSPAFDVSADESVIVLASPLSSATAGVSTWTFRARDGDGTVALRDDHVTFDAALADDVVVSELATVFRFDVVRVSRWPSAAAGRATTVVEDYSTVTLHDDLANVYDRASVHVFANVAHATHGQTVADEPLGSGDGAALNQEFVLKKPPLTYVAAATAGGAAPAITVRVDGIEWSTAPSLYGLAPADERYVVRVDDDGSAHVTFGDGVMGARLPTGSENVRATYRSGIGLDGMVRAGQLTLLQTRPHGVRGVVNPLAASGAQDPEPLDAARVNAPRTILTLDRIVSLRDYEDFARAFAGIGKAQATSVWDGERQIVHVTLAGVNGAAIVTGQSPQPELAAAIDGARDTAVQDVRLESYRARAFKVKAGLILDDRYVADDVLANVRAALEQAFSFGERDLGESVTAAEVMTVMASVAGVVAVDLDQLYLDTDTTGPRQKTPDPILTAQTAHWEDDMAHPGRRVLVPAELLLVDVNGVTLSKTLPG